MNWKELFKLKSEICNCGASNKCDFITVLRNLMLSLYSFCLLYARIWFVCIFFCIDHWNRLSFFTLHSDFSRMHGLNWKWALWTIATFSRENSRLSKWLGRRRRPTAAASYLRAEVATVKSRLRATAKERRTKLRRKEEPMRTQNLVARALNSMPKHWLKNLSS